MKNLHFYLFVAVFAFSCGVKDAKWDNGCCVFHSKIKYEDFAVNDIVENEDGDMLHVSEVHPKFCGWVNVNEDNGGVPVLKHVKRQEIGLLDWVCELFQKDIIKSTKGDDE